MTDHAAEHALALRRSIAKRNVTIGAMLTIASPVFVIAGITLFGHRDVEVISFALFVFGCASAVAGPWMALRAGLLELHRVSKARRALDDARLPRATLRR